MWLRAKLEVSTPQLPLAAFNEKFSELKVKHMPFGRGFYPVFLTVTSMDIFYYEFPQLDSNLEAKP